MSVFKVKPLENGGSSGGVGIHLIKLDMEDDDTVASYFFNMYLPFELPSNFLISPDVELTSETKDFLTSIFNMIGNEYLAYSSDYEQGVTLVIAKENSTTATLEFRDSNSNRFVYTFSLVDNQVDSLTSIKYNNVDISTSWISAKQFY